MLRKIGVLTLVLAVSLVFAIPAFADGNGRGSGPVVYVYGGTHSTGLAFDSIVKADLSPNAPAHSFQKLEMGGPTGLQTEFGPGDQEYRGGRWWQDVNGNGEMDDGDNFFECPLLGPGFVPAE